MACLSPPFSTRDIRSPSVPELRRASQRQKYGGPPPPTDAFIRSKTSGSSLYSRVELGKPTTDLTAAEKYQIAQNSVGRLIGKRVNRNNQRTGENDPWRYWGPGRRWGKMEKRGYVGARAGVEILQEMQNVDREIGTHLQVLKMGDDADRSGASETAALEAETSHANDLMCKMRDVRRGDENDMNDVRIAKRKKGRVKRPNSEERWEIVQRPWEDEKTNEDEDWDVVSTE